MEVFEHDGEVEITGVADFDPVKIFECGQCFRWDADENGVYTGVARGRAARLRSGSGSIGGSGGRNGNLGNGGGGGGSCNGGSNSRKGVSIFISGTLHDFETIWHDYFDLDRDYAEIRRSLCIDDFMTKATAFGAGIRILQQDKWEALCSFIISQCNNIPRIKKIIAELCRQFGEPVWFEGDSGDDKALYTFPSAERLAPLSADDLAQVRCGYRAEYIIGAARAVADGALDLEALSRETPDAARAALKKLRGVGDKVADCALLFGLNMPDAFPLDVWMKRAVAEHYGPAFDPGIFSPYAGIAQQYIFHYMRNG